MFALYVQLEGQQNNEELSSDMQAVLEEYSDVFDAPTSLPPTREIDHKIPLKDGTEAINVRPYRYAYFQKTEIENQVRDMLNAGLIRPSTSPFSSPVLLVKKKRWHMAILHRLPSIKRCHRKGSFPNSNSR